jgi:hypothetical protein
MFSKTETWQEKGPRSGGPCTVAFRIASNTGAKGKGAPKHALFKFVTGTAVRLCPAPGLRSPRDTDLWYPRETTATTPFLR